MGPIERELRKWPSIDHDELLEWLWSPKVSSSAFEFAITIHPDDGLSFDGYAEAGVLRDVLSEAIEAAGALNL